MTHTEDMINGYVMVSGFKLGAMIDEKTALIVKPKPYWMPYFLYKAVIRETVELVKA